MSIRVRFRDFWPNFDPSTHLLTVLIGEASGKPVSLVDDPQAFVDVDVFSSFPFPDWVTKSVSRLTAQISSRQMANYSHQATYKVRKNYPKKAVFKIWYTGENVRPPLTDFDVVFSHDSTGYTPKNVYFPYWMTRLNWGYPQLRASNAPSPESLTKSRTLGPAKYAACTFASNLEPNRIRIIGAIEKKMSVTKFGRAFGNKVESKMASARPFLFQICNENSLYPGYVTEKLQEAWLAGNVPVWDGILPPYGSFNSQSFLNLNGLNFQEIVSLLDSLSMEDILTMRSQPLHNQVPSLEEVKLALKTMFSV